jgi:hypothetical protein
MKKSAIYKAAQRVVVNSMKLEADEKLEILRELMERENLEKFCEEEAEKEISNEIF